MGEATKRLLAILSPPFREVAAAVGVSYDTVKGWSAGRTDPSPENRAALATYARRQAAELARLADELEG